jgi:aspartate-semialdehyde dehydrogenase
MMNRIKAGIMGCTGLVGQQFIRMLENHPYFEVAVVTASNNSAGKRYGAITDWIVSEHIPEYVRELIVQDTTLHSFRHNDIAVVFSALPAGIAEGIEKELAKEGYKVFSNASAFRMDSDVPVIIPEVNAEHMELVKQQKYIRGGYIVTNSNCSTAGMVILLKPLMKFGIQSVNVTTYQALSGAGRRGVASLAIMGNVIPHIKNEEEKLETETLKILGTLNDGSICNADLTVNASCCRVPVRDGHLESVVIEFQKQTTIDEITNALNSFRASPQQMNLPTAPSVPIIVKYEEDRPQPALDVYNGAPERARGMAVTVGRIRQKHNKFNLFLLSHNAIRGAAGTCILNAEYAYATNYISKATEQTVKTVKTE